MPDLNSVDKELYNDQLLDASVLRSMVDGSIENIVDDTISLVRADCFYNDDKLKSIKFDNCTVINVSAFNNCINLSNIDLPALVTCKDSAFYKCNSIKSVFLPNLQYIGGSAFSNCTNLETVSLPKLLAFKISESSSTYSTYVFFYCQALRFISIPLVTYLPDYMFQNNGFRTSDDLNITSCQELGSNVLSYSNSLSYFYNNTIKKIGDWTFSMSQNLKEVSLTACEETGDYTFGNCRSLTYVNFPALKYLNISTFYNTTSLIRADCPMIESIKTEAFYSCTGLKAIRLDNCKSIASKAFDGCINLKALILGTSNCVLEDIDAFSSCPSVLIYVPSTTIDYYKAESTQNWNVYADNIREYDPTIIYTVTFYHDDRSTVLYKETIGFGVTPYYKGDTPVKDSSDIESTYVFDHWDTIPDYVTADINIYAVYKIV